MRASPPFQRLRIVPGSRAGAFHASRRTLRGLRPMAYRVVDRPGLRVVYAGGVVLLFREGWEPLAVGALGALCLIMLILWEGAAVNLDRERKPLSDWLP